MPARTVSAPRYTPGTGSPGCIAPWPASTQGPKSSGRLHGHSMFGGGTAFRAAIPVRPPLALPGAWPLEECGLTRGLLSRCFRRAAIAKRTTHFGREFPRRPEISCPPTPPGWMRNRLGGSSPRLPRRLDLPPEAHPFRSTKSLPRRSGGPLYSLLPLLLLLFRIGFLMPRLAGEFAGASISDSGHSATSTI
jgi:hypothetical protein